MGWSSKHPTQNHPKSTSPIPADVLSDRAWHSPGETNDPRDGRGWRLVNTKSWPKVIWLMQTRWFPLVRPATKVIFVGFLGIQPSFSSNWRLNNRLYLREFSIKNSGNLHHRKQLFLSCPQAVSQGWIRFCCDFWRFFFSLVHYAACSKTMEI